MNSRQFDLGVRRRRISDGFTIVELLVVVVVIAILAAITIVSYNGITKRAAESALMSDASSAATQLSMYKATNNDQYPATTTDVNSGKGVQKSSNTMLQYTVNNGAAPSYCMSLTSTSTTSTYYVSSANNTPTSGLCPGHVTNYPIGTNPLTPPANTSNITVTTPPAGGVNMAYSGFVSVTSSATGTPTPTVVAWQRLAPKNSSTGTWEVIAGQTAPQLNWAFNVGYDITYNEGDYFYVRPIYTNSSGTTAGNAVKFSFYYDGD